MDTRVSLAGPAVGWFDRELLHQANLETVDDRTGRVVAVCVDGLLPPTTMDLDLVQAISAAVGRCVVVPVVPAESVETAVTVDVGWRRTVAEHIPVIASTDPALPDVLEQIAAGAANPVSPSPADARRLLVSRSLAEERSFRARQTEQEQRRVTALRGEAVVDALGSIAPEPSRMSAADLDQASKDAAEGLRVRLDLDAAPHCPPPEKPPRSRDLTDLAVGALTCGAALGLGRLVEGPVRSLGVPDPVPVIVSVLIAIALTAVVVSARRRQRRAAVQTRWAATHISRLRRQWQREIEEHGTSVTMISSWRAEFLASEGAAVDSRAVATDHGRAG